MAVRFKIFPFTEAEVLEALLTCHRDHVAFIDELLNIPEGRRTAIIHGATATTTQKPIAVAVVPGPTPFDRLRRFINRNIRRRGFIDLRTPGLSRLRFKLLKLRAMRSQNLRAPVYVGEHDGAKEYWFPGDRFAEIAGGTGEASALKKDVASRGLLVTTRRGRRLSLVVKRPLPDGGRPFSSSSGIIRRSHRGGVRHSRPLRPRRSPPKHGQ